MKKVCLVVTKDLTKNRIFDRSLHRDNCFDGYVWLKKLMDEKGFDLATHDINNVDESDIVIYTTNMPKILPKVEEIQKSYIILSESSFIYPENFNLNYHRHFNKVFTWCDTLITSERYVKLNFPNPINDFKGFEGIPEKQKLCVMIAGNKKRRYDLSSELQALDLYIEREKAIRWFENNYPEDFSLYGTGWDKYLFSGSRYSRYFNKLHPLRRVIQLFPHFKYLSYKGQISDKNEILSKFKFSICYENAKNIPGYITEKIFDSFMAGCVPIYLGANNIQQYVPANTYLDKRDFKTYYDLHRFLKNISDNDYGDYLQNIKEYLNSERSKIFSSEYFAKIIVDTIVG